MPIYEYQCQKCKKVHEIWQKITEDPITKCPDCKGKVERLIAPTGFILKGGGWYKDGYGSKGSSSTKSESSGDSGSAASDAKPTSEKAEAAAEIKKKNDTAKKTDPKHKSNSPKAKG